jgi:hypothetical protein
MYTSVINTKENTKEVMTNRNRKVTLGFCMAPLLGLVFLTPQWATAYHSDEGTYIMVSVTPQKANYDVRDTVTITGKIHALPNGFPLIVRVFNPENYACSFQQVDVDSNMRFRADPVLLEGPLCSVPGEYTVTVHYGSAKVLTKFYVQGYSSELTAGKVAAINAQIMYQFLDKDERYPTDLDWTRDGVLVSNNMNRTISFFLMFAEFDGNQMTEKLSYEQITLGPLKEYRATAPFVPQIVDGRANGFLHVFVWTSLESPIPLHPGLYIPY